MPNKKQIIAMGGGGFSMEPDNLLLDRYVIEATGKSEPVVCFLPTASGDSSDYIVRFYAAFSKLPCRPRHLSLFRQPSDLKLFIEECDVIYVGGGNTRNMLAIWRDSEMDQLLREAWELGTVLCGLSAGAICWFEQGHTDSSGKLGEMDCLGFLPGSCSPHYDGEVERRPSYREHLAKGLLSGGIALDDGAAARFVDTDLVEVVTSRSEAGAFRVTVRDGEVSETALETRYLGGDNPVLSKTPH